LLVVGWGRILPAWLLEALPLGAYGVHGSGRPLPWGRGRSPVNWTIATGGRHYFTHLFRLTPGTDDGPVVAMRRFDISPFDDALTVHLKNTVVRTAVLVEVLPAILAGHPLQRPQPADGATYLRKRTEDDRVIRWSEPTEVVRNLVRAESRPFAGCGARLGGRVLRVWAAVPFELDVGWDAPAGEVLEVFYDGSFAVRTGDTAVLVRDYDGGPLDPSDVGRRMDMPASAPAHPLQ
jgi:methionyl-tRNA formyltransferase